MSRCPGQPLADLGNHAVGNSDVGGDRQVRAVLLGRGDRQDGDGLVGVERREFGARQFVPEEGFPHETCSVAPSPSPRIRKKTCIRKASISACIDAFLRAVLRKTGWLRLCFSAVLTLSSHPAHNAPHSKPAFTVCRRSHSGKLRPEPWHKINPQGRSLLCIRIRVKVTSPGDELLRPYTARRKSGPKWGPVIAGRNAFLSKLNRGKLTMLMPVRP
jgi:hypothetical protein